MPVDKFNVLVFDSGLGGLTVVSEIRQHLPNVRLCYLADNQFFPYGKLESEQLVQRVIQLMQHVINTFSPDAIVIACNTASTLALEPLRQAFKEALFLGVVPPIKPAAEQSVSQTIALLATEATSHGAYTGDLIRRYAADCTIIKVADPELAVIAESKLYQRSIDKDQLKSILRPLLRDTKVDTVALGCTHYPHLLTEMQELLNRPAVWLNPAPGLARHLKNQLQRLPLTCRHTAAILKSTDIAYLTQYRNGKTDSDIFSAYGFTATRKMDIN